MKLSSILKDYPVLSVSDRPIAEGFCLANWSSRFIPSTTIPAASLPVLCSSACPALMRTDTASRRLPMPPAAVLLYAAVGLSRSRKTRCRYLWRIRATR